MHLPLPLRQVAGVHVLGLEGGEEELDGCRVVAVRSCEQHRDPEALHQLQRALASRVGGIVV